MDEAASKGLIKAVLEVGIVAGEIEIERCQRSAHGIGGDGLQSTPAGPRPSAAVGAWKTAGEWPISMSSSTFLPGRSHQRTLARSAFRRRRRDWRKPEQQVWAPRPRGFFDSKANPIPLAAKGAPYLAGGVSETISQATFSAPSACRLKPSRRLPRSCAGALVLRSVVVRS